MSEVSPSGANVVPLTEQIEVAPQFGRSNGEPLQPTVVEGTTAAAADRIIAFGADVVDEAQPGDASTEVTDGNMADTSGQTPSVAGSLVTKPGSLSGGAFDRMRQRRGVEAGTFASRVPLGRLASGGAIGGRFVGRRPGALAANFRAVQARPSAERPDAGDVQ